MIYAPWRWPTKRVGMFQSSSALIVKTLCYNIACLLLLSWTLSKRIIGEADNSYWGVYLAVCFLFYFHLSFTDDGGGLASWYHLNYFQEAVYCLSLQYVFPPKHTHKKTSENSNTCSAYSNGCSLQRSRFSLYYLHCS